MFLIKYDVTNTNNKIYIVIRFPITIRPPKPPTLIRTFIHTYMSVVQPLLCSRINFVLIGTRFIGKFGCDISLCSQNTERDLSSALYFAVKPNILQRFIGKFGCDINPYVFELLREESACCYEIDGRYSINIYTIYIYYIFYIHIPVSVLSYLYIRAKKKSLGLEQLKRSSSPLSSSLWKLQ